VCQLRSPGGVCGCPRGDDHGRNRGEVYRSEDHCLTYWATGPRLLSTPRPEHLLGACLCFGVDITAPATLAAPTSPFGRSVARTAEGLCRKGCVGKQLRTFLDSHDSFVIQHPPLSRTFQRTSVSSPWSGEAGS
jgi:hypothetical protein